MLHTLGAERWDGDLRGRRGLATGLGTALPVTRHSCPGKGAWEGHVLPASVRAWLRGVDTGALTFMDGRLSGLSVLSWATVSEAPEWDTGAGLRLSLSGPEHAGGKAPRGVVTAAPCPGAAARSPGCRVLGGQGQSHAQPAPLSLALLLFPPLSPKLQTSPATVGPALWTRPAGAPQPLPSGREGSLLPGPPCFPCSLWS